MTYAVAMGALDRARELVGQLDWNRSADELDRVQAGIKHELETARQALELVNAAERAMVVPGLAFPADVAAGWDAMGLVRNNHGDTAKAAAESIKLRSGTQRAAVLLELFQANVSGMDGLSDETLQAVLGMGASSERPRRVELCRMGYVDDSGKRVVTTSGREAVVWQITDTGIIAARKLEIQDPLPLE